AVVNQKTAKNTRAVSLAAAVLAVVALHWLPRAGVNSGNGVDLVVYVRGAQAIVTRAPLYASQTGVLPFTCSPFAALVFPPLLFMGSTGARWVLTLGSLASY